LNFACLRFVCPEPVLAKSRFVSGSSAAAVCCRAALQYKGKVQFWEYNWQTDAMTKRKYEVSAEERFYKQEYCGCSYSLRDSNLWRKSQGIPPVRIGGETAGLGTRYFEDPEADAAEESQVRSNTTPVSQLPHS
jgi:hypothetical protein